MKKAIRGAIRCPNHGCPLEISEEDKNKTSGQAPCQISGAMFSFTQDIHGTKMKLDVNGNLTEEHTYIVDGDD